MFALTTDLDSLGTEDMLPLKLFPFDILCGDVRLRKRMIASFKECGFVVEATSPVKLIIDVDHGYALSMLEQTRSNEIRSIVVTWNSCPEYLLDIQDFSPRALLTPDFFYQKENTIRSLYEVLHLVADGEAYLYVAEIKSKLSSCERSVLRYTVRGWKNKQISKHLGITEQTVRNYLRSIYNKLEIINHSQAILYYWQIHYCKCLS